MNKLAALLFFSIGCSEDTSREIVIEEPVSDASIDITPDTNPLCNLVEYCSIFQYKELACRDNNGRQLLDSCNRPCWLCGNAISCIFEEDNSSCTNRCRNCN